MSSISTTIVTDDRGRVISLGTTIDRLSRGKSILYSMKLCYTWLNIVVFYVLVGASGGTKIITAVAQVSSKSVEERNTKVICCTVPPIS